MGIVAASNEAAKKKLDLLFWRFYCAAQKWLTEEKIVCELCIWWTSDLAGLLAFAIIILR